MPKFGKDADLVLNGICKILMCFDDESWLAQTTAECLDALDQMVESTYLQTKLVEQKIRYFVKLCWLLFEHGSPAMQGFAYSLFVVRAGKLMDRFTDYVIVPLSRDDQLLASEDEKIEAILGQMSTYADSVSMAIKMIHLWDNRQENQLKVFLVNIIKKAVQLTSAE